MTCFKTLININELQFIVSNMNREPYLGIENTQWVGVGKLVKCSQTTEIQDLIFNFCYKVRHGKFVYRTLTLLFY